MRPIQQNLKRFNLAAMVTAIVSLTVHGAMATLIIGDTVNGDLTVSGWGKFSNGVDLGQNGELLFNWLPVDQTNPFGTATFDIVQAQGAFLWRDTITAAPPPAAKNKMKLDGSNALTLYRSDGTPGLLLDPQNGKITVIPSGINSGIFFGACTTPTLAVSATGDAIFPAQVTLQNGLQLIGGVLQIAATTPATSSTSGALTVVGGIGVGMDSYFNGVRIGKGSGSVATNTAIGSGALNSNTSGYLNTASGANALFANTTGAYNTASGAHALRFNTTGAYNTASGVYALNSNTTGYYNTASGVYALNSNTTGYYNTASGVYALNANTAGGYNTASGLQSLRSNTTGSYNTVAGAYGLYANTTGTCNTAVGLQASYPNTIGSNNVALGSYAAIYQANGTSALTDPENCIYIGANVKGYDNSDSNSIVIGSRAIGEGANTTVIGNSSTTKTHLYGDLVASSATLGGYPVLTTRTGTSALLTNSALLALGNNAISSQRGAIAVGQSAQATMTSALALGDSASATANYATAIQQALASGIYAFAASWGRADGDYSLGMAVGQAYGVSSVALGGYDDGWGDANHAGAIGSVALGGVMNAAIGAYSYALGSKVTSASAYSFAIGSQNLSRTHFYPSAEFNWDGMSPGVSNSTDWIEESALLEVGNGNPAAATFETSNAITTLKNGQTTLTNKAWKSRPVNASPLGDPGAPTTDSEGNALIVEGHTILRGKVVIEQAQGDISMGIYGDN